MFRHALEVGIRRTIDAAGVGKGFGEIGLREAKELFLVECHFPCLWQSRLRSAGALVTRAEPKKGIAAPLLLSAWPKQNQAHSLQSGGDRRESRSIEIRNRKLWPQRKRRNRFGQCLA